MLQRENSTPLFKGLAPDIRPRCRQKYPSLRPTNLRLPPWRPLRILPRCLAQTPRTAAAWLLQSLFRQGHRPHRGPRAGDAALVAATTVSRTRRQARSGVRLRVDHHRFARGRAGSLAIARVRGKSRPHIGQSVVCADARARLAAVWRCGCPPADRTNRPGFQRRPGLHQQPATISV